MQKQTKIVNRILFNCCIIVEQEKGERNFMAKIPQKLERKKSEIYKDAPIAKFGERKPDFTTMGRKIKNPHRKFRKWFVLKPAGRPTAERAAP